MQTNGSLRNAVTRGDRECHAKLGDGFINAAEPPQSKPSLSEEDGPKGRVMGRECEDVRLRTPALISISRKIFCTNAAKEKKSQNEAPHLSSLSCVCRKSEKQSDV